MLRVLGLLRVSPPDQTTRGTGRCRGHVVWLQSLARSRCTHATSRRANSCKQTDAETPELVGGHDARWELGNDVMGKGARNCLCGLRIGEPGAGKRR